MGIDDRILIDIERDVTGQGETPRGSVTPDTRDNSSSHRVAAQPPPSWTRSIRCSCLPGSRKPRTCRRDRVGARAWTVQARPNRRLGPRRTRVHRGRAGHTMARAIETTATDLVVDLSEVEFMDAAKSASSSELSTPSDSGPVRCLSDPRRSALRVLDVCGLRSGVSAATTTEALNRQRDADRGSWRRGRRAFRCRMRRAARRRCRLTPRSRRLGRSVFDGRSHQPWTRALPKANLLPSSAVRR
jgi:hypothetical protein